MPPQHDVRDTGILYPLPFPKKDAAALEAALQILGVQVRYNIRAQRGEFCENGCAWTALHDRNTAKLRRTIGETFEYVTSGRGCSPLNFGEYSWHLYLNAILAECEIDPFFEWLKELPPWDTKTRLDTWLATVFETDCDPDLLAWASRFIFLGPVWRADHPGTKLDEMPVLIGPQGVGKSTALRLVFPADHPEWFADGLHLAAAPKERAEALQGRVIVEASEMAGASRADLESLKAFLSRTDDGSVRLAYRRNPENLPRRCVIIGTANAECLPNDPTGLRRFVPIRLLGGDVGKLIDYLRQNRDQLWAEALVRFINNVEARLPAALFTAQAEAAEGARRRDDLMEDAVERWLMAEKPDGFTMSDAVSAIGIASGPAANLHQRDARRVAAVLRRMGYDKKQERRNKGRRVTLWRLTSNCLPDYRGNPKP